MRELLTSPRMGRLGRSPGEPIRMTGLKLSASNPVIQTGRRSWRLKESPKAKDLIYHAYCDEGFVNTPKKKGLESFWTGEHMEILGGGWARRGHGSCTLSFPTLASCISSIWLFYPFIINQEPGNSTVFLSSVSPVSKLIDPEREVWDPPIYSWSVRNLNGKLDSWLASKAGRRGQSCGTEPVACGIWCISG